jgi:Fur family transcriptional regulator, ferric uptake regulator
MTTFRSTETVAAESVTAAIAAVRSHGLRLSTSRRMVLEALFAADAPIAAEQIASGLGGQLPQLDLASVYRNLDTLEQLGVVRHFHPGHGPGLYTLAGRERCEYLVCEWCGTVGTVDPGTVDPVRAALAEATGWRARFAHFPIVGTCPACVEGSA